MVERIFFIGSLTGAIALYLLVFWSRVMHDIADRNEQIQLQKDNTS